MRISIYTGNRLAGYTIPAGASGNTWLARIAKLTTGAVWYLAAASILELANSVSAGIAGDTGAPRLAKLTACIIRYLAPLAVAIVTDTVSARAPSNSGVAIASELAPLSVGLR